MSITRYDHCDRSDCYGMRISADGDYVEYDDYQKLEARCAELEAAQMTEERAREVLGDMVNGEDRITCDTAIHWPTLFVTELDGDFTSEQLRAIAWWMDNKSEVDKQLKTATKQWKEATK